ncbi:TetR/AcrR family transcriptional regulator [Actinoplanes sp. Pm04-4]|uniref:TetR/AcrR family transcriptional regulator n=1 Tax=Paractinoplanes pyxinae TaxID=2997416 RepID=A0ABT4B4N6_9ACTN|nr:TetR/AcrR family transcriptional regulator [Actinoplanes pyxinae]MCY1141452.1 TetR/AcrR family transcriptional regulator [Actinoplanes pyxinae]
MTARIDHDKRRRELAATMMTIIAESGMESATMRQIAQRAGYANGALAHYFRDKNELNRETFRYIFSSTMHRIDTNAAGLTGLAALRVFCIEMVPCDDIKREGARVVIPFWQRALHDDQLAAEFQSAFRQLRHRASDYLRQALHDGELHTLDEAAALDRLSVTIYGLLVLAVLSPAELSADRQIWLIDDLLDALRHARPAGGTTTSASGSPRG